MSDFEDPPRWSEGASPDAKLGALLQGAREDSATSAQLAELSRALGGKLGSSAAAGKAALALKVGGGALVLAALGGAYLAISHEKAAVPAPSASAAPSSAAPIGSTAQATEPALPLASSIGAEPAPAASTSTAVEKSTATSSSAPDEATLLERARAALDTAPAQALALTAEDARRFPRGVLAQEREVIAIAALRRLGRASEADKRAQHFEQAYPNSAHQQTVEFGTKR